MIRSILLLVGLLLAPLAAQAQAPALSPEAAAPVSASSTEIAVETQSLPAPNLQQSGIFNEGSGGLAVELFKDMPLEELASRFMVLGKNVREGKLFTSGFYELARRLALTKAYDPEGSPEALNAYWRARINLALELGAVAEAATFIETKPSLFRDEDWDALTERFLGDGDFERACASSVAHPPLATEHIDQKMSVFCDLLKNNADHARLQLDVLREAGDTDTFFLELAERALTRKGKISAVPEVLSPLHLAIMTQGSIPVPEALMVLAEKKLMPVLTRLAAPLEWRVGVTEKMVRAGIVGRAVLEMVYNTSKAQESLVQKIRDNPDFLQADDKGVPETLRLFYGLKALEGDTPQVTKAHIVSILLRKMNHDDLAGPLGHLVQKYADSIAPLPDMESYAPQLARLALMRDGKEMQNWWRLSTASPVTREEGVVNLPLALMRNLITEEEKQAWIELYLASPALAAPQKIFNLMLLRLLQQKLPASVEGLLQQAPVSVEKLLASPVPAGRRGDVLLAALENDGNAEQALRAVQVLLDMGAQSFARRLAISLLQD